MNESALTLGKKIAAARRSLGREWTQERLARALKDAGLTHTRAWVAGVETDRIPARGEDLKVLAKILKKPLEHFDVSKAPDWGSTLRDSPTGVDMASYAELQETAPVMGVVSADRFSFSFEAIPDEHIPNPWPRKKGVFALRISGDCMEPTFHGGEFVFLSESQQVVDGKVVLAQLDGEYTLKRYFRRADHIELRPDNPKYRPIKVSSSKLTIRGVVVGTYRKDI